MKHLLRTSLCALSLVLLTACGAGITAPDGEELQDAWDRAWSVLEEDLEKENLPDGSKRHCYQILNSDGEELYTVTDETQVAALDGLLGNAGEELRENPVFEDGEEIACVYVYRQEKTLLAGEDPQREREYEEVIRFTVCRDQDLITVQCLKGLEGLEPAGIRLEDFLTFTISVPAETMESLRNPAQFAGE